MVPYDPIHGGATPHRLFLGPGYRVIRYIRDMTYEHAWHCARSLTSIYSVEVPHSSLTRGKLLERRVINALRAPLALPHHDPESSVAFELKRSSETLQSARVLARKRGLDPEIAGAGALLHHDYVIEESQDKDHETRGASIARHYMEGIGGFNRPKISNAETLVRTTVTGIFDGGATLSAPESARRSRVGGASDDR